MTDGEQTKDPEDTKSVNEILAEAVQPLKDKGVRVITLGIGKKSQQRKLTDHSDWWLRILRVIF